MNEIKNILNQLKSTNSNKEKGNILSENKDNELLKRILEYTYNPFKKYGLTEKVFIGNEYGSNENYEEIFSLLDKLEKSNINDKLRAEAKSLVNSYNEDTKEIVIGMMCKNLKIGISPTTINKIWKNLIPSFGVQLAANYKNCQPKENEYIFITEKLDGIRCVCIYQNGQAKFYSRQGKEITGLNDIETEINTVCNALNIDEYVFDGELLKENYDNLDSGSLYRETTSIVNSKAEDKKGIIFNMFDILPLQEFKNGIGSKIYKDRRKELENIEKLNTEHIHIVPVLYEGTDHSKITELLKEMESNEKEGVMINRNFVYEVKRTKSVLKVKSMESADLRIVGFEEGRGKNAGTLGAVIVDYKGYKVNVGSGFSDEDRKYFWNNQNSLMGKIVEIQYFEESENQSGGLSLRFPVYLRMRLDKTEPSYN